jgi:hypothetical protein
VLEVLASGGACAARAALDLEAARKHVARRAAVAGAPRQAAERGALRDVGRKADGRNNRRDIEQALAESAVSRRAVEGRRGGNGGGGGGIANTARAR